MSEQSELDLLGYLLGALDADEQASVQHAIDADPDLEQNLLRMKQSLAPLELIDRPTGPPVGLARRTCQIIAMAQRHGFDQFHERTEKPLAVPDARPVEHANRKGALSSSIEAADYYRAPFTVVDFVVAATAATLIGALIFPAIMLSRFDQRVTACQSNLSSLYRSLATYADAHSGHFVSIPNHARLNNVGSFAPILKDAGLIERDSIFLCPGIAAPEDLQMVQIPNCAKVADTECMKTLAQMHQMMAGNYAYTMGHFENDVYVPPRDFGRSYIVLLADAPSCQRLNRASRNHSNRGQNLVMESGQVIFSTVPAIGDDLIYVNDENAVRPGLTERDSVVAPSYIRIVAVTSIND